MTKSRFWTLSHVLLVLHQNRHKMSDRSISFIVCIFHTSISFISETTDLRYGFEILNNSNLFHIFEICRASGFQM